MLRWGATVSALAVVTQAACGPPAPHLRPRSGVLQAGAGHSYRLRYSAPLDEAAIGTRWSGADLTGSPLASMQRPVLIIKADDFGGPFNYASVRFIEAIDAMRALASPGIVAAEITEDHEQLAAYQAMSATGFELWLHGYRHHCTGPNADFAGRSVGDQVETLHRGLFAAREALGFDLHAFGAPCNAIDANTAAAVLQVPEIVVWLFGTADQGTFVLPRIADIESKPGTVREPARLLADIDALLDNDQAPEAITLQVHPGRWIDEDFRRLDRFLDAVAAGKRLRYSAPFAYWSWRYERERLVLTKTGDAEYVLDLSRASLDQRIDFDPLVTSEPAEIATLD
jgi:predicted deacetylase